MTQGPLNAGVLAMAMAHHQAGRFGEAEALYLKLLKANPADADALALLGALHVQRESWQSGIILLQEAIRITPGASTYNNLAVAQERLKQHEDAAANCMKAILLNPEYSDAHYNLGISLHSMKQYEEAVASFERSLAINPAQSEAHNNLGNSLVSLGRYEEAVACYDQAIAISSTYAEAWTNRGYALYNLLRFANALASYDNAIAAQPDYAEAYWHKGLLKLLLGEYKEGWKLHEWRWKRRGQEDTRTFSEPLWLGEPLQGKTILLHAEQGLGDTIQFCRYVPMVEALGAKIILELPAELVKLISTLKGTFKVVVRGEPLPAFDLHCPLMSLPLAFKTEVNSIPANIPYLFCTPDKRKKWQQRLGEKSKPRVGMVWSGNRNHANDRIRSIAFENLEPLWQCDVHFHCLQKDILPADEVHIKKLGQIISHAEFLGDFSDTAALISEMDLVIAVDTAAAHLAGALGKPVWVLLASLPDFRWMTQRDDSPWYPTARLFRQTPAEGWAKVMEKVTAALKDDPRFH